MTSPLLLEAKGIAKSFSGVPALREGRLELRAGSVHALCGGNGAGKSTFLNILMGILQRDAGEVLVKGRPVHFHSPADALGAGIAMITQELEPIPHMTVAENIYLGREPKWGRWFVKSRALARRTRELLERLEFDLSPNVRMSRLSLAQIQLVEIAKAISYDAEILIMDEPTSAIGEHETEVLFATIRRLKERGVGIIYVSHRMNEIFEIADDYTVFRDGGFVESGRIADITRNHLINEIMGCELEEEFAKFNAPGPNPLLEVRDYSRAGEFENMSLTVRGGEILGIFGLMGAGRSEFLNCLFGVTRPDSGSLRIDGKELAPRTPREAMQAGLALVTEDRKESGLVLSASVRKNISLASMKKVSGAGFVKRGAEVAASDAMIERFRIKTANRDLLVRYLSGGNQQKVVLAKWMRTQPKVLLLDEPTRGVDVGAKREIYHFMSEFASQNKAVIMVSSEIPEVIGMSDRVIVFRRGKMVGELSGSELTQENLAHLAS